MMNDRRELAAGLLASDSEEMRHLGEIINELCDELHSVRVEYNELYDASQALGDKAIGYKRERDAYREALMNAVEVIDDWEECETKSQHTNTINAIEELLWPLARLPEDIMKLVREVLSTCNGACDE